MWFKGTCRWSPAATAVTRNRGPPVRQAVDGYSPSPRQAGITGWAQINGCARITSPEKIKQRVEHDLYYIEKVAHVRLQFWRNAMAREIRECY